MPETIAPATDSITPGEIGTGTPNQANAPAPVISMQPKPAPVFEVARQVLELPEDRTKLVALPDTLRLEADPSKHQRRKGHQIDPSRSASCIPVMPCRTMFETTGNPYPLDPNHPSICPSEEKWRPYVLIGHHAFALLAERGELRARAADMVKEVLARAVLPESTKYAEPAVSDALRDLALAGLADQFLVGRSRVFRKSAT